MQSSFTIELHGISMRKEHDGIKDSERKRRMTYFRDHSLAVASYRARSVLYKCAMSGTSGSSGFGSVNIEQMDNSTKQRMRSQMRLLVTRQEE